MQAIKQAIRDQLINAGVNEGTAIYDTYAPAGSAYPYVLFQYVAGGYENLSPLATRNELWQVKAVTDDHMAAHTLAAAIKAALHVQPLTITGWNHIWTVQMEHVWMVELLARQQIYHAGGTFRIRLHQMAAA
jgi:hypothetical protein